MAFFSLRASPSLPSKDTCYGQSPHHTSLRQAYLQRAFFQIRSCLWVLKGRAWHLILLTASCFLFSPLAWIFWVSCSFLVLFFLNPRFHVSYSPPLSFLQNFPGKKEFLSLWRWVLVMTLAPSFPFPTSFPASSLLASCLTLWLLLPWAFCFLFLPCLLPPL